MPDFGTKSQGRDFPAVHGEMMYGFQLPSECRDFAELCTGKAAYPPISCRQRLQHRAPTTPPET